MITIGTLGKSLRKHTEKQTEGRLSQSIMKRKKIVEKLSIDDRVDKMQENEAFITIKDHKEGFFHYVSCRLLNPSKMNIGKISKILLDKINLAVPFSTKIN